MTDRTDNLKHQLRTNDLLGVLNGVLFTFARYRNSGPDPN